MENPMSVAYVAEVLGRRLKKERQQLAKTLRYRMIVSGRSETDANRVLKEAFKQMYQNQQEANKVRVAQR